MGIVDEAQRVSRHLVVDGLHPLFRERPGILDAAVGIRVHHAPGSEALLEFRIFRVIRVLGLFFGIQVVKVAEEFVEAVVRGEELVLVPQVILPELAGGVAHGLEQLGDGRVFRRHTDIRPRHPHLGEARANGVLAGDERGPTGGAALLCVVVGEGDASLATRSMLGVR